MQAGITLPWWSLVLVALLVIVVVLLSRESCRERFYTAVRHFAGRLQALQQACERRRELMSAHLSDLLERYFTYQAHLRLQLGLIDYEQLVQRQHLRIEMLCKHATELVRQLGRELESTASEVPEAPEWVASVEAVSKLPEEHQGQATAAILEQILVTARRQHEEAMREYRWSVSLRSRQLHEVRPAWTRLQRHVGRVEALLGALDGNSVALNEAAARYADLRAAGARRTAGAVALRFVIALVVAVAGLLLTTYNALLLREVIAGSTAGSLSAVEIAAVNASFIAGLLVLGAVLASSLRWSNVLPMVAGLLPRARRLLAVLSGLLLAFLSASAMTGTVDHVVEQLAVAGWPAAATWVLGAGLYLLPLLTAALVPVLEQLLRAGKPLTALLGCSSVGSCGRLAGFVATRLLRGVPPGLAAVAQEPAAIAPLKKAQDRS